MDTSYKKPKNMPYKVDLDKQEEFKKTYEELKSNLAEDESIYFMDAVHPTQTTKITTGWIKTGTDKPIKTTGSRTRINIVGAIRLGHIAEAVTSQYKTVNGESIINFMGILRTQHSGKGIINLIVDGASYYKSHVVRDEADRQNIKLHVLPPYSPNLNPIERLWKVMNEKVRNNQCFHGAEEFRQQIDHFFDHILSDIGVSLDSRINDNFQKFEPAMVV
jgi:transposase